MQHRAQHRAFALTALSALFIVALPTQLLAAETYSLDPVHSNVHFRVRHLSASMFQGRFNDISGTLVYDEADPSKSSIEIEVKAASVDTNNERLDGHIKSPDFLSAEQFPVIRFKSTEIKKKGGDKYEVTGEFSLRGMTKKITTEVEKIGTSNLGQFGPRIGFTTSFTINRRDFQVNYGNEEVLGDDVTLIIDLEGAQGGE